MLDGALAAIALGCLGALAWVIAITTKTTREMSSRFSTTSLSMAKSYMEGVSELVLGRAQVSAPTSEPSSTESPENAESKRDEMSLGDMPDHIREHYLREATEDAMMEGMRSEPSMTPPNGSSPYLTDQVP